MELTLILTKFTCEIKNVIQVIKPSLQEQYSNNSMKNRRDMKNVFFELEYGPFPWIH